MVTFYSVKGVGLLSVITFASQFFCLEKPLTTLLVLAALTLAHTGCQEGAHVQKSSGGESVSTVAEGKEEPEVTAPTIYEHLTKNTFTLNGGGSVNFNFIGGRTSGNIRISGGRADLMGTFQISSADMVEIRDLKAVSGMFDASNNSGTFGSLYLYNDGSLRGTIGDYSQSRDITLEPI